MKKKIITWVVVFTTIMLVSTVTAVPQTSSISYNEAKENEERFGRFIDAVVESASFNRALGRFNGIDVEINEEEIYLEIKSHIDEIWEKIDKGELSLLGGLTSLWWNLGMLLSDIYGFGYDTMILLFGSNIVGHGLGLLVGTLLATIPIATVAVLFTIPASIGLAEYILSDCIIDLEEIFYQFGLIGMVLFLMLVLPVAMVFIPWGFACMFNMYMYACFIRATTGHYPPSESDGFLWWACGNRWSPPWEWE